MALSTIQWTDYTFNPWIGCRKVAPECANCYAETLDRNRYSKTLAPGTKENPVSHWGSGPRHRTKTWGDPLKWNRLKWCEHCEDWSRWGRGDGMVNFCLKCRHQVSDSKRPSVFCASLADWLDDESVPIEWFADLLKLIHDTPNLDWLLLTKRPQNWKKRVGQVCEQMSSLGPDAAVKKWLWQWLGEPFLAKSTPPANVWIGVSAGANQQAALEIPARVHFLSCEPMLRPLDTDYIAGFDWAIFGGESGSKARECHTDWIREGIDACRENAVAPFVKQLGSNALAAGRDQKYLIAMKDSHGGDMDEWPEDLRVREFPTVK